MSEGGLIDKQNMAHPYSGILLGPKRNEAVIHATVWMNLKSIMLNERSQT